MAGRVVIDCDGCPKADCGGETKQLVLELGGGLREKIDLCPACLYTQLARLLTHATFNDSDRRDWVRRLREGRKS